MPVDGRNGLTRAEEAYEGDNDDLSLGTGVPWQVLAKQARASVEPALRQNDIMAIGTRDVWGVDIMRCLLLLVRRHRGVACVLAGWRSEGEDDGMEESLNVRSMPDEAETGAVGLVNGHEIEGQTRQMAP